MPFEKRENTSKIMLMAALAELPVLAGGAYQFIVTDNPVWLAGAAVIGAAIFTVPAILRIKNNQERENASR